MDWIGSLVDLFLHLDKHLAVLGAQYGAWIYAILFVVIFAETGFVVTPFLPGDSLLFIAGSLAALGAMDVHLLVLLLFVAAVAGNTVNYEIGRWLGPRVFSQQQSRWLNPHYIERTHAFFERWGAMSVIIARFVPFLRTYVPFVAGIGAMTRAKYLLFTVVGGALWTGSLTYLGYFFGNIPWVKANQGLIVVTVIILSVMPIVVGLMKARLARRSVS